MQWHLTMVMLTLPAYDAYAGANVCAYAANAAATSRLSCGLHIMGRVCISGRGSLLSISVCFQTNWRTLTVMVMLDNDIPSMTSKISRYCNLLTALTQGANSGRWV